MSLLTVAPLLLHGDMSLSKRLQDQGPVRYDALVSSSFRFCIVHGRIDKSRPMLQRRLAASNYRVAAVPAARLYRICLPRAFSCVQSRLWRPRVKRDVPDAPCWVTVEMSLRLRHRRDVPLHNTELHISTPPKHARTMVASPCEDSHGLLTRRRRVKQVLRV